MAKPLLLVDFDRTLFDTGRFVQRLWGEIAAAYGVDPVIEQQRAKSFYRYAADDWYDYDFFAHVNEIKHITDEHEVFVQRMHAALGSIDFLYDDVKDILPLINAIVTFGNKPYQQFKLDLCPSVEAITTHIITEEKGKFIAHEFQSQEVILVDDKRLDGTLPETAQFIHLARNQERPLVKHNTYVSINSLSSILKFMS